MRLPGPYCSLPQPSSPPEPSHPPGGVCSPGPSLTFDAAPMPWPSPNRKIRFSASALNLRFKASYSDSSKQSKPPLRGGRIMGGDPAAGSPTATLLRLTRPCRAKARPSLRALRPRLNLALAPLGWVDGRCVQGAGTYSPRDGDARLLGIPGSRGRVAALDPDYDGV